MHWCAHASCASPCNWGQLILPQGVLCAVCSVAWRAVLLCSLLTCITSANPRTFKQSKRIGFTNPDQTLSISLFISSSFLLLAAPQIPIYDFKQSKRVGFTTTPVPSSRVVVLEGIYALNERLKHLLDLRVSIAGEACRKHVPLEELGRLAGDVCSLQETHEPCRKHAWPKDMRLSAAVNG